MHAGTTQRNERLSLPFLTHAFCSWVVSECSRNVDVHIREKLNDVQRFFTTLLLLKWLKFLVYCQPAEEMTNKVDS